MKEQRTNDRISKAMDVWLYKDNCRIALARTKNIAPSGMFIRADVMLFPRDCQLEVEFDGETSIERHRVAAKVVHRSLKGMGIAFHMGAHPSSEKKIFYD